MPTLGDIADLIGAPLSDEGRRNLPVEGVGTLEHASERQIAFLSDERYQRLLATTRAAAVVVGEALADTARGLQRATCVLLIVPNAAAAMQRALEHLAPPIPRPPAGVHPAAIVPGSATLGRDVAIGPNVVLGERVTLGDGTILHAGVVIGDDVSIGEGTELFANVVVRERCTIGNRVTLNAGVVIGTDGFGYRWDGSKHAKLPHIGTVVIEDDVEIGSGSCVDRGKVDDTRIGAGTKIDNLVQIGHNVRIGRHCIICGGTAVGGSSVLEDGVIVAGAGAIADHTILGAGARVAGMSGVHGEIPPGETVAGLPATQHANWLREQTALHRLPELLKTVRALASRVAELEARRDGNAP